MNFSRMVLSLLGWVAGLAAAAPAVAQDVAIPNLWDPRARQERPDLSGLRTVRFLTDDDFPPLHFVGPDGAPIGVSVEFARAACERLGSTCTIQGRRFDRLAAPGSPLGTTSTTQARRFDTLADALSEARGDVIAAAMPITPALRRRFSMTLPYFRFPARFAARADKGQPEPNPRALDGRTVAVVQGTAHEAYLKAFFARATVRGFEDLIAAEGAVRRGEADYVFGDGLGLSLWLGGTDAAGCCGFIGGAHNQRRLFREGIGLILGKEG